MGGVYPLFTCLSPRPYLDCLMGPASLTIVVYGARGDTDMKGAVKARRIFKGQIFVIRYIIGSKIAI